MSRVSAIATLSFGAVFINTIPLWIGSLGRYPAVSEELAGVFASLVLVSAAVICADIGATRFSSTLRIGLSPAIALLAFGNAFPAVLLGFSCLAVGIALGSFTGNALHTLSKLGNSLKSIGIATSVGLSISVVFYLIVSFLGAPPLVLLLVFSLPICLLPGALRSHKCAEKTFSEPFSIPFHYIGFFVMMGAYWAFLDLFGARFNDQEAVGLWLLTSLISGAVGSITAASVPQEWRRRIQTVGMLMAAVTGAASFLAEDVLFFGISILTNAFALFLFFPLYLESAGTRMPQAMGSYLAGFAVGGLAGALLVWLGGYLTLAIAILLSGLGALVPKVRQASPR